MADIRDALASAVQARLLGRPTDAGVNVFLWRDWPLNSQTLPAIVVRARRLEKHDLSGGNGVPHFSVQVMLELDCFVQANADLDAETAVRRLEEQASEVALGIIIGPPQTFRRVALISSDIDVTADGAPHTATAELRFAFEVDEYQVPDVTEILERILVVAIREFSADDSVDDAMTEIIAGADFPIPP